MSFLAIRSFCGRGPTGAADALTYQESLRWQKISISLSSTCARRGRPVDGYGTLLGLLKSSVHGVSGAEPEAVDVYESRFA
jgi:hypothetical protein